MDMLNESVLPTTPSEEKKEIFPSCIENDGKDANMDNLYEKYNKKYVESMHPSEYNIKPPLDTTKSQNVLEEVSYPGSIYTSDFLGQKRKKDPESDDNIDAKKAANMSLDEKKTVNMRKNIRDVMDENQLDTNTLAAQREESERLARVAEQQKIIRENQRQAAVNRNFVRTQNRVLSLLQSSSTFAKVTNDTPFEEAETITSECTIGNSIETLQVSSSETVDNKISEIDEEEKSLVSPDINDEQIKEKVTVDSDIVTIEDSSSEDDCILLSDDEEELEDEEEVDDPGNSGLHVKDAYNVPDEKGRVLVNIGHPEGEEDIFVAPQIAKTIKPHQIGGVRFLFDNIIESTKRFKSSSGFGCILSHSMGLGKTLQVICFCDIFLRHTSSKTVLCVMPINTLQNWVSEFNMWLPRASNDPEQVRPRQFDVFVLNDQHKTLSARAKVILKWAEEGGVLLIGYELFRLLALKLITTRKRRGKILHSEKNGTEVNRRLMESIHQALVKPGPDLVICDEGHRIKNSHAGISLALKQIRTRRRIVLTGYPLQNNLLEYWCMVDFVRPNYLGTRTEFCNMFERPIQNGQCIDSTPEDIKLMRYRAHVLHSLLLGFVQRRSHAVLQQTLPRKLEYVVLTRMTSFQRQLYETFMNDIVRTKSVPNPLKAFAVCCKIWNHPDVLYNFLKTKEIDLDLEIEDGEIINEPAQNVEANASIKDSKQISLTTNVLGDIKQNQNSNSANILQDRKEQTVQPTNSISQECGPINEKSNTGFSTFMKSSLLSENFNQQNNDSSYMANCGGNNYWQEPNVNFFPYQSVTDNIDSSSKPSYVGMVPQRCDETINESENELGSSQIVDLDTKEIKTVETDIDMTLSPVIKNKASQLDKNLVSEAQTELLGEDERAQNSINPCVNEEDTVKIKGCDSTLHEWAIELMKKYKPGIVEGSPKMEIFFCILNESIELGDRVLLFSQSLLTLNLIETFLHMTRLPHSGTYWTRGVSYFRLDGSTTSQERERLVNEFNSNHNVKLFLISTKAGSLGINLVGANRVIVFDASWNPCHDTQAVYRIYRYGQNKPCFVYRIVMDKCLEKKIYDRQIKKQGMSDRVVDECNPDAHLSIRDITNLCHDYDDDDKSQSHLTDFSQPLETYEDTIVQKIVEKHKSSLSKKPFYHESLLIDRKEKKLSQAEKRQAHRGYEMEKKACVKQTFCSPLKSQYRFVRTDGSIVTRPVASIRPMQTTKTTNAAKSAGIRTTRWIPAEVWQRQGMTAQEMTLPLDVVIPTHSNDKSNIILKSGQRVMVLKSAKGIYMQLESGKIIAIRTSSKAAEVNKTDKDEVIDITNEGDSTTEKKNEAEPSSLKENNTNSTKGSFPNTSKKTTEVSESNTEAPIKKCVKSNAVKEKETPPQTNQTHDQHIKRNDSSKFDTMKEIEKKHAPCLDKSPSISSPPKANSLENNSAPKTSHKMTTKQDDDSNVTGKNDQHHEKDMDTESNDSSLPINNLSVKNPLTFPNQLKGNAQHPNKPVMDSTPFPFKQMGSYPFGGMTPTEMPKFTHQRGEIPPESYQNCNFNSRKLPKDMQMSTDYTASQNQSLKQNQMTPTHQPPYSQYSLFHQQQQPKLHLYGSNFNIDNSHYSNSAQNSLTSQNLNQNHNLINDTFSSVQEMHGNGNNVPNPCDYSSHFPDYPYGSYNPHYFPHFHSNSYGNGSSAPLSSNPYPMHWPPLITPNSLNEQCNPVHSSVYPQNSAQHNQWHHKL